MTTEAHIVPVGDAVEHDITDDCICGPLTVPIERIDGSVGWLIVHHALDNRPTNWKARP